MLAEYRHREPAPAQGRQRAFENRRESQQRFAARAGDAVAYRHQLSVTCRRRPCNSDGAQITVPVGGDDRAQVFIGRGQFAYRRAACRSGEYAVREDRAAVRVDAACGAQHARLGSKAKLLKLVEFCFTHPCRGNRDEVAAQRKQAAHKGCGIHVTVRAVVAETDQPRLGIQRKFTIQAAHHQAGNMARATSEFRFRGNECFNGQLVHASISSSSLASTSSALDSRFTNTRWSSPDFNVAHSRQDTELLPPNSTSPSARKP